MNKLISIPKFVTNLNDESTENERLLLKKDKNTKSQTWGYGSLSTNFFPHEIKENDENCEDPDENIINLEFMGIFHKQKKDLESETKNSFYINDEEFKSSNLNNYEKKQSEKILFKSKAIDKSDDDKSKYNYIFKKNKKLSINSCSYIGSEAKPFPEKPNISNLFLFDILDPSTYVNPSFLLGIFKDII